MKNMETFVIWNRIKADVKWADSNPNMTDFEGNHFKVILKHQRGK